MCKAIILLLLLTSFLQADPTPTVNSPENFLSSNQESLATVMGCVNVFTGSFFQVDEDLVVDGPERLSFTRTYDSADLLHILYGSGFGTQYSLRIRNFGKEKDVHRVALETQEGSFLEFKEFPLPFNKKDEINFQLDPKVLDHGLTNYSEQGISAHTNFNKIGIHFDGNKTWKAHYPNGGVRTYTSIRVNGEYGAEQGTILTEEKHPSGNRTVFICDSQVPNPTLLKGFHKAYNVNSKDEKLNSISFSNTEDGYQIKGSNGQTVTYKATRETRTTPVGGFKTRTVTGTFLTEVSAPHLPTTKYSLIEIGNGKGFCKIGKVEKPDGRQLEISYEKGKVAKLKAPVSQTNELLPVASFEYADNKTTVISARGNKSVYHSTKEKRLKAVDRYLGNELYSSTLFSWDKSEGWLNSKAYGDHENQIHRAVTFHYDRKGNIIRESFLGNLTGNGPDTFPFEKRFPPSDPGVWSRYYTYSGDSFNLKLSERDTSGLKIEYQYKPGTNLLIKKTISHHNQVYETISHEYDQNAVLIKTVDNGKITEITPISDITSPAFGKPAEIKEGFEENGYHLLRKTKLTYSNHGFLAAKETYDSSDNFCFSETYEYDERDLCIKETDPLGRETTYEYDANHNKIAKNKAGKKVKFTYDFMNRLTQVKEVFDDRVMFRTKHEYDLAGNRVSTTDHFGNTTTYLYDALNRLIETHDPLGSVRIQKYDCLDRIISLTDENGHETTTRYNAYDHPIEITHPDGTVEKFEYTKAGWLLRHTDQEGVKKEYKHDPEGRVIKESLYDKDDNLIEEITRRYKGRHLVEESDFAGNLTQYKYDGAGRRIEEKRSDRVTTFAYDNLGRLKSTTRGNQIEITEYDFLDRPIEERLEDTNGALYKKVTYEYDQNGNKTAIHTHIDENTIATEQTHYNARNEPVLKIDPMGCTTRISYNYESNQKTITDPNGIETIETFDPLHRLVSTKKKDKKTISHEELFYDAAGHKIKQIEHVYENGSHARDYTLEWSYDSRGRLKKLTEQGTKVTSYSYTAAGRLYKLTKPDGVVLKHTYYPNGLLKTLTSSDKSISYQYEYDTNHNPITISGASKTYNIHNELTEETLSNGLTTQYAYDSLGRLTLVTLPDQSTIEYQYDAFNLIAVLRNHYLETYENFDLLGRARRSTLASIEYTWDNLGRRVTTDSPHWSETLDSFDAKGNLLKWTIHDPHGKSRNTYTYDALDQLTSENKHTYVHDSLNNRLQKDKQSYHINQLNQYESDSKATYKYDLNGNLTEKTGEQTLTYDALNRLTAVTTPTAKICYTYDATGRCLTRAVTQNGNTSTLFFHYQFDTEIGAIGENHQQLRILGLTRRSKIGQTLAVELNNTPYYAISDHLGSLRALVSPSGIQTYRYSAFGERQGSFVDCPWGFNNKRLDPDTGYLRFPKRDYSPDLGRWLTPDPLNYADGPNLYAYVKNNPLMFEDPYGLFMTRAFSPSFNQGFSTIYKRGFFNPYETVMQPSSLPSKIAANDHDAVSDHLMDHSLQRGELTGAMLGVLTRGAADYIIARKGLRLYYNAAKSIWNGLSSALPNLGRGINGEVAGGMGKAPIELNRFHQAARNLSETGKNNIRILRGWAKSKGWVKEPNISGGPEKWGTYRNGDFKWNLKIKPEESFRVGLDEGSHLSRFDARLEIGGNNNYINPFTNQKGDTTIGTHIPLNKPYY